MGWNGSGQVVRTNGTVSGSDVWTKDRDAGRKITSALHDAHDQDMADAIENSVARDGQNSPSADLPMGGQKHTGVGDGTARNHYAAVGQVQDGDNIYAADGGSADAYTVSLSPVVTALVAGMVVWFKAANTSTGASTLTVNGISAAAIRKNVSDAIEAGDIVANKVYACVYDGTNFQLVNPSTVEIPDNAITQAKLADNAVGLAEMAPGTDGNLITYDANGDPAAVATGTSGQVLTSNGAGAAPTFQAASGAGAFTAARYYTSGTSWSKPGGLTRIIVKCWGGGGGGNGDSDGGGGGGGGAYSEAVVEAGSLASSETVTIGAAGAGASGGTGGTGGDSSFGTHCVAKGGGGGSGTSGGAGGAAGSGTGDLTLSGGPGANGANSSASPDIGGGGGGSPFGGAGGPSTAGAEIGTAPGGGGGGQDGGTAGAGAAGLIIVYEYN